MMHHPTQPKGAPGTRIKNYRLFALMVRNTVRFFDNQANIVGFLGGQGQVHNIDTYRIIQVCIYDYICAKGDDQIGWFISFWG